MAPSTGYAIADITALKAIVAADRADRYLLYVASVDSWYRFNSSSSAVGDDNLIVVPSSGSGRWIKTDLKPSDSLTWTAAQNFFANYTNFAPASAPSTGASDVAIYNNGGILSRRLPSNGAIAPIAAYDSAFDEAVDDRVGALLTAGSNITLNYNDGSGTLTISSSTAFDSAFNEAVDDRVFGLLVAGTNITLDYNDAANTLTINSTGGGGSSGRTQLVANRTYYVHFNTGSDSNNGLTSGASFKNLQKAIDVISALDLNGYTVTINCDLLGNPTAPVVLKNYVGPGHVKIVGDSTSSAFSNPLGGNSMGLTSGRAMMEAINISSSYELVNFGFYKASATAGTHALRIEDCSLLMTATDFGFDIQGTIGNLIYVGAGGVLKIKDGTSAGRVLLRDSNTSYITCENGGYVEHRSAIQFSGFSVSNALFVVKRCGVVDYSTQTTYNGTGMTGKEYDVSLNGVIVKGTSPSGATAGTTATGGQVG